MGRDYRIAWVCILGTDNKFKHLAILGFFYQDRLDYFCSWVPPSWKLPAIPVLILRNKRIISYKHCPSSLHYVCVLTYVTPSYSWTVLPSSDILKTCNSHYRLSAFVCDQISFVSSGDHTLLDISSLDQSQVKFLTVRTKSGESLSADSISCKVPLKGKKEKVTILSPHRALLRATTTYGIVDHNFNVHMIGGESPRFGDFGLRFRSCWQPLLDCVVFWLAFDCACVIFVYGTEVTIRSEGEGPCTLQCKPKMSDESYSDPKR